MKNKLKHSASELLSIIVLILLFLVSRLRGLTVMPIFGDEAIYIRWSQIIRSVDTLRFIPLTDGKQPLFMWLTVPFLKIFTDPLYASRLLSVLAGVGTLLTIYLIIRIILKLPSRYALLGGLIYTTNFFSFFFDRLATPDNLLTLFSTLSLLFCLMLAKTPRLDLSMILGVVLGLAWLTKSPAIYFVVLSIGIFIIYNFRKIYLIYFPIFSSIIAFAMYNILRLGPQFHQISLRTQDYVWPISEILKHPLDPFKPHLSATIAVFNSYFPSGYLVLLLTLLTFLLIRRKTVSKAEVSIFLWFFLPLIATLAMTKIFTARYILFSVPPLIIITVLLLAKASRHFLYMMLLPIYFSTNLFSQTNFIKNSANYSLPDTEKGYLQDWTSGWGIHPTANYLIDRATSANVIVGTEGYFGTLPDGLQIYTNQKDRLTVIGVGIGYTSIPGNLIDAKNHGDEVYLVGNLSRFNLVPEEQSKLKLIKQYPKPDGDIFMLYQL